MDCGEQFHDNDVEKMTEDSCDLFHFHALARECPHSLLLFTWLNFASKVKQRDSK